MAEFVQRRPTVTAEEYDGSRESADRVMATFVRPPEVALEEYRFYKWTEAKIQDATVYKWHWFDSAVELDRPAVLADGSHRETGFFVQEPGLWLGYEDQGAGTGVTTYMQIPLGYVYTGWSLKPNWMSRKDFLKDWEPAQVD
jgi:hypothetical protein